METPDLIVTYHWIADLYASINVDSYDIWLLFQVKLSLVV